MPPELSKSNPASEFPPLGADWLLAPDERDVNFLPAFARISLALQETLRARVPAAYFENAENFRDTKKAYPMLVYQASKPFRARMRTDLTYDVLNPVTLARVFRSARQGLPDLLVAAELRLIDSGLGDVARAYQPRRSADIVESVQRLSKSRRCLYVLIRSENALLNTLIDLAGLGALRPKDRRKRKALFEKRWNFELRRIYPGMDCLWLAPDLLEGVTRALSEFLGQPSAGDARAATADLPGPDPTSPGPPDYST